MIDDKHLVELSAATRALEAASEKSKAAWEAYNDARREELSATHRHEAALRAVADAA